MDLDFQEEISRAINKIMPYKVSVSKVFHCLYIYHSLTHSNTHTHTHTHTHTYNCIYLYTYAIATPGQVIGI